MPALIRRKRRWLLAVLAVLLLGLAACGSGGSTAAPPAPTTSAPAATPSPTATPSPSQTPSDAAYSACLKDDNSTYEQCYALNPHPDLWDQCLLTHTGAECDAAYPGTSGNGPAQTPAPPLPTPKPTPTPTPTPVLPKLKIPTGQYQAKAPGTGISVTNSNISTGVVTGKYTLVVNSLQYSTTLTPTPDTGYVWLVANVTFEVQSGTATVGADDFTVPTTTDTNLYPESGSAPSPVLPADGTLTAGQSKTGNIAFQVPSGQHGVVSFSTGSESASWQF